MGGGAPPTTTTTTTTTTTPAATTTTTNTTVDKNRSTRHADVCKKSEPKNIKLELRSSNVAVISYDTLQRRRWFSQHIEQQTANVMSAFVYGF